MHTPDMSAAKRSPTLSKALRKIVDEQFDSNISKLARAVDVSPSTAKRWLEGMVPKSDALARICRKCRVSAADLLGEDAEPSGHHPIPSQKIANREQAAAVDYLVGTGEDPDAVAMAAAIVASRLAEGETRPRLWWAHQVLTVMRDLG